MHNLTDGYVTVSREEVTPQDLFDLAHDVLNRLDALEWSFSCLLLLTLDHLELISQPDDGGRTYKETVASLQVWMRSYREAQERIDRDRQFMDSPE